MELTKDADLLVCCAYKEYLTRRKSGVPKSQANIFNPDFKESSPKLSEWLLDDYMYTIGELKRAGLAKMYIDGTFIITDQGVIYMENRFKNGLKEITDFVSKFMP
ncbi:hypothetical protein [Massiliimalia timonensis]|uniref:hypothetical protein n=1 Tax=Massiliimalia timonensis TaxID=1987501 RepID=UPI00189E4241|nr:hypothetical protein [Massiliimalia timonensis]